MVDAPIDVHAPTPLLGGLSPRAFMRRVWQRSPLLVRQAWPGIRPPLPRSELFALAAREGVESRLVVQGGVATLDGNTVERAAGARASASAAARGVSPCASARASAARAPAWQVRHGPFTRRALPPLAQPGWTLLVQGLDLHVPAAHAMLAPFRFVPAARLDDLMVSWASEGGGVGPHADSYDVFLLQVQGRRRWRVAPPPPRQREAAGGEGEFVAGLPLKILRQFRPVHDWVLEPGDMLYLPPRWGHDGVAVGGDCMTCSVGFRSPTVPELAGELLQRLADEARDSEDNGAAAARYADPAQPATARAGEVPAALQRFAARAVARTLREPGALERALGEVLSEPKPQVWFERPERSERFEQGARWRGGRGVRLDARTRMLWDARNVFINGESFRAGGRDARLLRELADRRALDARAVARLSEDALRCLVLWVAAGWLHEVEEG